MQGKPTRPRGRRRTVVALLLLIGALVVLGAGIARAGNKNKENKAFSKLALGRREAPRLPELFLFTGSAAQDPVERLLDRAEAVVRRGDAALEAGHLERAREEFDRAVDLLLSSSFDLRQDPRLRFGFDHIVDHINQLELGALREAATAEEPPSAPTPLEELTEIPPLTFPLDPALRAQVEAELNSLTHDLPLEVNEQVLSVLDYFQRPRGHKIIEVGLQRSGRYRDLISSILEEEGVPRDLIFLAQAESAFQPNARSRARAVGIWQFMSFRAREYGLEVNWWVDERRDPIRSTRAAAKHLRDLYEQFGDWYLALAAYNCGPNCVQKALNRAGGSADYWTLAQKRYLPRETRNYVPIILAMALVGKDPGRYGFDVDPAPPLQFEMVKVSKPTDLRPIAEVIGVDVDVLREMNPQVLRGVTPPDHDNFELYVPVGSAEKLAAELPQLPESERVYWQQYRVRRGDTLSHIASRYDTTVYAISQANRMSVRSTIYPGQVLVIPAGPGGSSPRRSAARYEDDGPDAEPDEGGQLVYRVRRGDTLSRIASRHRTSVYTLASANGLSTRSTIYVGQRLVIPGRSSGRSRRKSGSPAVSASVSDDGGGGSTYRVRRGDTLSTIADRHGTTASRLAAANNISLRTVIRPGDRLVIPGSGSSSTASARSRSGGSQVHRVRWGETLWDLARRYNVSIGDLRHANPFLASRQLRAGDSLLIPD